MFDESMLTIAREKLEDTIARDREKLEYEKPDEDRAYWYLLFSWMGLNGTSGTPMSGAGTFCVRYSAKGGNGPTRWQSVCESIPDWHQRLSRVQILRRDAFVILEQIDDAAKTSLYIDPPYLTKSSRYVHDFKPDDHLRLANQLRRFKVARVVVSYYDYPLLAELYPGWTKVNCGTAKAMVQSGMRDQSGKTEAPEVLLVNGPTLSSRSVLDDSPLFKVES